MNTLRCPTLAQLPPPPPNKTGWPWTEDSRLLPDKMADGSAWPRLTIVTPSYNQGQFIEETIRSVLLQGYPNLEYIITDGGSNDDTVSIIRKYEPWLAYWVSEKDNGQSHAINKGFNKATGSLINWLNSDDLLLPNALNLLAIAHAQQPTSILLGDVVNFVNGSNRNYVTHQQHVTFDLMVKIWQGQRYWHQPGIYIPYELYKQVGGLDEQLRYVFDRDWLCRLLREASTHYLNQPIVKFRLHEDSKTVKEAPLWLNEQHKVTDKYAAFVKNLSSKELAAGKHLYAATLYLGDYSVNRGQAIQSLGKAIQNDWHILMTPEFAKLLLKIFMPIRLISHYRYKN